MSHLGVRSSAFHRDCAAAGYFEEDGTEGLNLKADDQSAHADDQSLALHTHLDNRLLRIFELEQGGRHTVPDYRNKEQK